MAADETTVERAELMAEQLLPERTPKLRMLVIANPYATTMSDRLKGLVAHALESRYRVNVVDTERRRHATQICREAAGEGYDVVVAFGGDGTVNEVANGLAGSGTPLTCLPGGATNVLCRALGIPGDVVDATEHLLRMADDFRPYAVDLGRVEDRMFVCSSGIGLDAHVVGRVEAHPGLAARLGRWYYTYAALTAFHGRYLLRPPLVEVEAEGARFEALAAVVQNADPYTFFGDRPVRLSPEAGLRTGTLGITALRRAGPLTSPALAWRLLSRGAEVSRHRRIEVVRGVRDATVRARGEGAFPVQVDGDFLGEYDSVRYSIRPRALTVVA